MYTPHSPQTTNMEPENPAIEKEHHIIFHPPPFWDSMLLFSEVVSH